MKRCNNTGATFPSFLPFLAVSTRHPAPLTLTHTQQIPHGTRIFTRGQQRTGHTWLDQSLRQDPRPTATWRWPIVWRRRGPNWIPETSKIKGELERKRTADNSTFHFKGQSWSIPVHTSTGSTHKRTGPMHSSINTQHSTTCAENLRTMYSLHTDWTVASQLAQSCSHGWM